MAEETELVRVSPELAKWLVEFDSLAPEFKAWVVGKINSFRINVSADFRLAGVPQQSLSVASTREAASHAAYRLLSALADDGVSVEDDRPSSDAIEDEGMEVRTRSWPPPRVINNTGRAIVVEMYDCVSEPPIVIGRFAEDDALVRRQWTAADGSISGDGVRPSEPR